MTKKKLPKRPTIAELKAMLNSEETHDIKILPNGEIRAVKRNKKRKPLTLRENIGGEYGEAA